MKTAIFVLIILFTSTSFAQETKRSKSINFEDSLVEGINRKPLDSFNQISELESRKFKHLYHKRAGFEDRNRLTFQEMNLKQ